LQKYPDPQSGAFLSNTITRCFFNFIGRIFPAGDEAIIGKRKITFVKGRRDIAMETD
jgi:hypothetical protein